jgi:uncharacterized protein DUF2784
MRPLGVDAIPGCWRYINAMAYFFLILIVALVHFGFVLFVIAGGLLAFQWPTLLWWHLAGALYGIAIMLVGWRCPLTRLEAWLRERRGERLVTQWEFLRHYVWSHIGLRGNEWFITVVLMMAMVLFNYRAYRFVIVGS